MELKHLDIYHIEYREGETPEKTFERRFETIKEAAQREEWENREPYCTVEDCQCPYHP